MRRLFVAISVFLVLVFGTVFQRPAQQIRRHAQEGIRWVGNLYTRTTHLLGGDEYDDYGSKLR
jgi:hypothetical protein